MEIFQFSYSIVWNLTIHKKQSAWLYKVGHSSLNLKPITQAEKKKIEIIINFLSENLNMAKC